MSRDRLVSIGRDTYWTAGVRSPEEELYFSVLHNLQIGSGSQPASYMIGTGITSPGDKAARE
jgi:hypothetical protein